MTISPSTDPVIKISIELLPEFGFTVQDEPVYGPGSVFQGIVHLRMKESPIAADRIVINFRGAETATSIHDGNKFLVPLVKNPFFSMQQTLWQRTREDCLLTERHYQFPFTIQMPMIQFPPSMNHSLYLCQFDLSAKLVRTTFTLPTVVTQRTIQYMPFIETSLLKQPVVEKRKNHSLSGSVRLHSLEYVPGDAIPMTLEVAHQNRHRQSQPSEINSVLVELCETVKLHQFQSVSSTRVVASQLYKPNSKSEGHSLMTLGREGKCTFDFQLPVSLTPSINYSKIVQVSYQLNIKVKTNKTLGALLHSALKIELPLTIGTLGYGIRASQDLKLYHDDTQNSPRFLRSIEYEESLPVYESTKLPNYTDVIPI